MNDNAPEFAMFYETFVCENVRAGQVSAILFLLTKCQTHYNDICIYILEFIGVYPVRSTEATPA